MTIHDALHYSPKRRAELIASYPKHIRRARAMGQPAIGEGAVYPIDDEDIICKPFDPPAHWMEIGGLDFGYDHPTAGIRLLYDPDAEIFYVAQEYRRRQATPLLHADALKGWGRHLPFAWGMEGLQTKLTEDPTQTWKMFQKHGLKMVTVHATFANGGVGIERGVTEIYELMMAGRFKVFSSCPLFFEEKNAYHRKRQNDESVAKIVKVFDDIMDAVRYAYMMFRMSVPVSWRKRHGGPPSARRAAPRGVDSRDIFGGKR